MYFNKLFYLNLNYILTYKNYAKKPDGALYLEFLKKVKNSDILSKIASK